MGQTTKLTQADLTNAKEIKALAAWIREKYNKAKQARLPFERQWSLNYAFYKGKQNVQFSKFNLNGTTYGGLTVPQVPPHRSRLIINRIKPIIRTEIARITSNKPNASVVPASSEDEDLFAAQAAEQVWESLYYSKKIHSIFSRAAFWMTICGTAFVKDWWDSNAIVELKNEEYIQGDICYGAVTPFHVLVPDLIEPELDDQPYIFNAYTKPLEWANNFFKDSFNNDVVSASEIMGESFFRTTTPDQRPDSVLIIECWFKPGFHKLFPNGGLATLVNDKIKIFHNEDFVYEHGEYPFTKFDHIPTGEFYADSVITDLIGPQREFNRTRNQILDSKNRMSKPQLLAEIGAIDPAKITTQPGQVILYRPGMQPPRPLQLQPIPGYVLQELDRIVLDMEDISSQHAISRGQAPSGVTAATAIAYLQERDDSPLTSTYQSVEQGWERIAKHSLSHVVQFWDVPRLVAGTGTDEFFDAITLKGSEIASGTDIRMEAGSALPVSKAAKQQFLMDCMKMGYIPPDKGLSMMDMGGINKLYDELKADERQAQRENLRMRNLDITAIEEHFKAVQASKLITQLYAQQNTVPVDPQQFNSQSGVAPEFADAQRTMQDQMVADSQPREGELQGDSGFGTDAISGAPLELSPSIIPVNSWDNHQVHKEKHNSFRKSQAFEMLPEEIKQQFEAHVRLHEMAIQEMQMQMLPTDSQNNPVGFNQFGPPGTDNGAPPQGAING